MSAASNAHAELPGQSTAGYASNVVCCTGGTGLGTSCSGTFDTVAKLSAVTNAHIQQNTQSGYAQNACMSVTSGTVSIGYVSGSCTGFDTTLASMSATTNAQMGSPATYTTRICGSAAAAVTQNLSFALSANTIGFGTLSSAAARYATSDSLGSASEIEAHTLSVSSNAASGYAVTVMGATMTSSQNVSNTITALAANTASSAGTEQFGLRMTAAGGVGSVTAPYAAAGFAYAGTAGTASQVAAAGTGDGVSTVYSVRYLANVGATTESGTYSSSLVYVATANF
ncbi:MAG: hypothetical protein JWN89_91 [Parcubacteria group bacterium]|nr:hypothetical protein [Parcubacteria group bacterium]